MKEKESTRCGWHALGVVYTILPVMHSRTLNEPTSTPPFSLRDCDTMASPSAVAFALARIASASPDIEVLLIRRMKDVYGKSN